MTELLQHWTPLATIAVIIIAGMVGIILTLILKGDTSDALAILAKIWALQSMLKAHDSRLAKLELERKPDETLRVKT